MLGLIFGAGIFALPAAVALSGIGWGIFHFILALLLMTIAHLWYAEVAFLSDRKERFTGFARRWIGRRGEYAAVLSVIVGYYGALLAYGVLGGVFLAVLFPYLSAFQWSVVFFVVSGVFSYFSFEKIGLINFYLTIPLVGFVLYLSGISIPHLDLSNFSAGSPAFWFLPYGIFIFSFGGFAAVPETSDIMKRLTLGDLRRVIVLSLLISAALYFVFIFAVVGANGINTTDDAIGGLISLVGSRAVIPGALVGFLAVFTSYLAFAVDMKNIFKFDYKIPKTWSWLLTTAPPVMLFILGVSQFLSIIGFVGAVAAGASVILIYFMARNLHRSHSDHVHFLLSTKNFIAFAVVTLFLAGAILELARISGLL